MSATGIEERNKDREKSIELDHNNLHTLSDSELLPSLHTKCPSHQKTATATMTVGGSSIYNYLAILTTGLGSFTYGFNSAVIGSVFGLPAFFDYFNLSLTGKDSADIIGGTITVWLLQQVVRRPRTSCKMSWI